MHETLETRMLVSNVSAVPTHRRRGRQWPSHSHVILQLTQKDGPASPGWADYERLNDTIALAVICCWPGHSPMVRWQLGLGLQHGGKHLGERPLGLSDQRKVL